MKRVIIFLFVLMAYSAYAQQDPQLNMYQFNQMLINPAYAGSKDAIAVVASNRQQWAGFSGAPQTTGLSVHMPVASKNIGVGLTILNDKIGPRKTMGFYGNAAYILKLSKKSRLSFGVNAGYNQYQFDFSMLSQREAEVPSQLLQNQNKGVLDINAGVYFKMQGFFAGVSASHINNPKVFSITADSSNGSYVYRANVHLYYSIGKSYIVNKNCVIAPTILIKQVNNSYTVDFNLNAFLNKKLWVGVFYRTSYGPGGLLQYYVTDRFKVGYSYDAGMGTARNLGGSHEVMIGFDYSKGKQKNISNPRFL